MRAIIVCGGREYADYSRVDAELSKLKEQHRNLVIIQGGARGADTLAAKWAYRNNIENHTICAEWSKHGKSAGMLRNQEMLEKLLSYGADISVVAFPGGRGTADMVRRARSADVEVLEIS